MRRSRWKVLLHASLFSALVALPVSLAPACGGDSDVTGPTEPFGDDCSVSGQQCDVLCDAALGCVDCLTDADCGAAEPRCVEGECVTCTGASDCDPGESCYPKDHECGVACADDGDCNGDNDEPLCDPDTGACVGCLDAADCNADEPLCSPVTQQCVECQSASDCGVAEPQCDDDGECRQCLVDGHCDADEICIDHDCEPGCSSNDDCSAAAPICHGGLCVGCVDGADCGGAAPICDDGQCIVCARDEHCPDPSLGHCNDNQCMACSDDDHCDPGLQCDNGECTPQQ